MIKAIVWKPKIPTVALNTLKRGDMFCIPNRLNGVFDHVIMLLECTDTVMNGQWLRTVSLSPEGTKFSSCSPALQVLPVKDLSLEATL